VVIIFVYPPPTLEEDKDTPLWQLIQNLTWVILFAA